MVVDGVVVDGVVVDGVVEEVSVVLEVDITDVVLCSSFEHSVGWILVHLGDVG